MFELKIIVAGTVASGKSAIAELIRQTLMNVGISAQLVDDNGIGIVEERPGVIAASLHERLASIRRRKPKIKIVTAQLIRENNHGIDVERERIRHSL